MFRGFLCQPRLDIIEGPFHEDVTPVEEVVGATADLVTLHHHQPTLPLCLPPESSFSPSHLSVLFRGLTMRYSFRHSSLRHSRQRLLSRCPERKGRLQLRQRTCLLPPGHRFSRRLEGPNLDWMGTALGGIEETLDGDQERILYGGDLPWASPFGEPTSRAPARIAAAYSSLVGQDVQQLPRRIAHEEATHTPGLAHGPVLDRDPSLPDARERSVEIIDLD